MTGSSTSSTTSASLYDYLDIEEYQHNNMAGPFDGHSIPEYFCASPLAALIYPLHRLLLHLRGPPRLPGRPIRVVCISDTHTLEWADVPDGDLLIHAGDLCNDGSAREIQAAVDWLQRLPHPHKVAIGGNHDSYFDTRSRLEEDREQSFGNISSSSASIRSIDDDMSKIDWGDIHYLQHSSVTLSFPSKSTQPTIPTSPATTTPTSSSRPTRSLTIYGAPQIPAIVPFGREHAFVYPAHHDAWTGTIPPETDILITHTPPASHRDLSPVFSTGCPFLLNEVWRVRPALHVFGHVHVAYGKERVFWDEAQRAWERLCAGRRNRAKQFYPPPPTSSALSSSQQRRVSLLWTLITGLMADLVDVSGWVDAARVVGYGVLGVVWARVWGGENRGAGWMVNAACMYENTGRLGNKPLVVEM